MGALGAPRARRARIITALAVALLLVLATAPASRGADTALEVDATIDMLAPESRNTTVLKVDEEDRYGYFLTEAHLTKVDLDTFEVTGRADLTRAENIDRQMALVGGHAYVDQAPDRLAKVDLSTMAVTQRIPVGGYLHGVVPAPDGTRLYLVRAGDIASLDLTTHAIDTIVAIPGDGAGLGDTTAVTPDGTALLHGSHTTLRWVELATGATASRELPDPAADIAVDPTGSYVYVAAGAGLAKYRIDGGVLDLIKESDGFTPSWALAMSADGGNLFAADPMWNSQLPSLIVRLDPDTLEASSGDDVLYLSGEQQATTLAVNPTGSAVYVGITGEPTGAIRVRETPIPDLGPVIRLAGPDRYATAVAASTYSDPGTGGTVYLATGTNFPDALAAGPLTQAAPLLLTDPAALPEATRQALRQLRPSHIVALGGPAAFSDAVLADAAQEAGGATTERVAGSDRYGTAEAIAAKIYPSGTVYLATGTNFPDALAGGAVAFRAPILLTAPDALPAATRAAISRHAPKTIVALGGPAAIPDAILAAAAEAAGGATTERIHGPDRYATAAALAQARQGATHAFVATGINFPDALAGTAAAIGAGGPILLTAPDHVPDIVADFLTSMPNLECIVVLGGPETVAPEVVEQLAVFNQGSCRPR